MYMPLCLGILSARTCQTDSDPHLLLLKPGRRLNTPREGPLRSGPYMGALSAACRSRRLAARLQRPPQ